ncbi:ATP-binding cassette domain-containing protein [Saccharopolyspora sp. WRP15-2]|uniref:ATP-binding cassette domain-containing protein n=1 Tax=Saccharopolyspora oryzae TaxID=2997343 RepID=A0ABT4UV20_9PSEU|nr:ATP-binding cassette domain-containing protein [Saccharopolyspora oryzae]MDA3625553.1 ATP-binding cassette domain-containing protein [Saccharopolyspora oryzae]
MLLDGSGLGKDYGGVRALSEVSIRVDRGEVLGLVGPNGAGKTTLVDLISGAQRADAGTLLLDGTPLRGPASSRARAGLARTFQHPQLAPDLSVRDNLVLGRLAARHGRWWDLVRGIATGVLHPRSASDDAAVERLAAELGIGRLDRAAGDLTLGEQRLVEVGRALGQEPLVLLLDEPFAGADAHGISGISDAIRAVRQRGHGVVLVDHNIDLVSALVDRMMLLELGAVAFDGDPADCLASPQLRRAYFGEWAEGLSDVS